MEPAFRTQERRHHFLPTTRGCASSKPSLPGPNSETCIGQSPRWISQQGALSRAEELFYGPSSEEGTIIIIIIFCLFMKSCRMETIRL